MPITTLACSYDNHVVCTSKVCECDCHKDPSAVREEAAQARIRARNLVYHAMADFQTNPDLFNTQTAILALTQYEATLKEARRGR